MSNPTNSERLCIDDHDIRMNFVRAMSQLELSECVTLVSSFCPMTDRVKNEWFWNKQTATEQLVAASIFEFREQLSSMDAEMARKAAADAEAAQLAKLLKEIEALRASEDEQQRLELERKKKRDEKAADLKRKIDELTSKPRTLKEDIKAASQDVLKRTEPLNSVGENLDALATSVADARNKAVNSGI